MLYIYIYVYQPNDFMIYHRSTTEIYDCMYIYIHIQSYTYLSIPVSWDNFSKSAIKTKKHSFYTLNR